MLEAQGGYPWEVGEEARRGVSAWKGTEIRLLGITVMSYSLVSVELYDVFILRKYIELYTLEHDGFERPTSTHIQFFSIDNLKKKKQVENLCSLKTR